MSKKVKYLLCFALVIVLAVASVACGTNKKGDPTAGMATPTPETESTAPETESTAPEAPESTSPEAPETTEPATDPEPPADSLGAEKEYAKAVDSSTLKLDKEITIGYSVCDFKIPFEVVISDYAQQEAERIGNIKIDLQDAGLDINKEISNVENFISKGVDIILVASVAPDSIGDVVKKANDAGIPVFSVNRGLGDTVPVTSFVGCNDVRAGYLLGDLTTQLLGEGNPGKVACIQGGMGSIAQMQRWQGTQQYIAEKSPAWELVAEQTDDWDQSKAINVVQNFLQRFPKGELDVIMSQDPFGCTAGAQVIKDMGRQDVKLASMDMPKEVHALVKSGEIAAAINQDPAEQGIIIIQAIVRYLNGETLPVFMETELPYVWPDNVDNFTPTW